MLTEAGQEGNPLAEVMWDNEKRKQRQQEEERNTRHSVDKGQDFIESGMTLITDVDSEKYLKRNT